MKASDRDLIEFQLRRYLLENHSLRFGQALFNLGITQFANVTNPSEKEFQLRDIYNDLDKDILERMRKELKGKYKLEPHSDIGTLYTLADFDDMCKCGGFINYDGFGHYSNETHESNIEVRPSHMMDELFDLRIDEKLTHVMWYNR